MSAEKNLLQKAIISAFAGFPLSALFQTVAIQLKLLESGEECDEETMLEAFKHILLRTGAAVDEDSVTCGGATKPSLQVIEGGKTDTDTSAFMPHTDDVLWYLGSASVAFLVWSAFSRKSRSSSPRLAFA